MQIQLNKFEFNEINLPKPLFYGDIVFSNITIAGAVQHSATKYSKNKKLIDNAKLF
jgi:hypothetical protein